VAQTRNSAEAAATDLVTAATLTLAAHRQSVAGASIYFSQLAQRRKSLILLRFGTIGISGTIDDGTRIYSLTRP